MSQNQVQIVVSGRSYTIYADADGEKLRSAVERINKSIDDFRKRQWDELRATTVAAVTFAYDLIEHEEISEATMRESDAVQAEIKTLQEELREVQEKQVGALEDASVYRERFDECDKERTELLEKVVLLEKKLQDSSDEKDFLKAEFDETLSELKSESSSNINKLEGETEKLCKTLTQLEGEHATQKSEFEVLRAERDELKNQVVRLESVNSDLSQKLTEDRELFELEKEELTKEASDMIAEIGDSYEIKMKDLNTLLEKEKYSGQENRELWEREKEELLLTQSEKSEQVEKMLSDVAKLETTISSLEQSSQEEQELFELEREELLESQKNHAERVETLSSEISELQRTITSFEEKSVEEQELFKLETEEYVSAIDSLKTEIHELENSVKSHENKILEQSELFELEKEEFTTAAEGRDRSIESLKHEISELEATLASLGNKSAEERDYYTLEKEELLQTATEKSEIISAHESEITELKRSLEALQLKLDEESELFQLELAEQRDALEDSCNEHKTRIYEEQNLRESKEKELQSQLEEKTLAEESLMEILKKITVHEITLK